MVRKSCRRLTQWSNKALCREFHQRRCNKLGVKFGDLLSLTGHLLRFVHDFHPTKTHPSLIALTFCLSGKSVATRIFILSSPLRKHILLFRNANHRYIRLRPVPPKGAYHDRRERGAGCGGREWHIDERAFLRTEKACGPGTPTLVSSWREVALMTVAKRPGAPGRARYNS